MNEEQDTQAGQAGYSVIGTIELRDTGRYESFGHRRIFESPNKAWTLLVPSNLSTDELGKDIEIRVSRLK